MRVFMLGWEFPPFISGGLGTACYGLTKALSRRSVHVTFVLPKEIGEDYVSHVRMLSPQSPKAALGDRAPESVASSYQIGDNPGHGEFVNVIFKAVPSRLPSPYKLSSGDGPADVRAAGKAILDINQPLSVLAGGPHGGGGPGAPGQYAGDLIGEAQRYANLCLDLARGQEFEVIHAHDWLTYPAGMAVAAASGKPLVVHVHSTEFDRSGEHIHQQIYDIERRGMHAATRVIAVSHMTKRIINSRYGIHPDKVDVVYNGIDSGNGLSNGNFQYSRATIRRGDKIVLFLGRITMQKGPEYFVAAAQKVLEKMANVKFVMAGSGDKVRDVIELAAAAGIGHKVLFTGFLHSGDVERIFRMADVYVMPSVSEPFGIAPLEAIAHDVPVIISKTSGVSEVLTHALKVDFWDTHEIANKIIAVLKHPPLASTLREHADMEVKRLNWDDAAGKTNSVYDRAIAMMPV
jgi:glycosyltransferase involved in cell wall biosynthesis